VLAARLRAVVVAKDAEIAALRQELDAERELRRRLELRLAELERRLPVDSTDSGTPSSKERVGRRRHGGRGGRNRSGSAAGLRERYDTAAAFGITHNRLRDWHQGNHPGYALGCWLRDYKEQVFLFTRDFAVDWTNNVSERGAKAAQRHQAVSGYWHSLATLARWCRVRSYLESAAAHGITALGAIRDALAGKPWLPPLPAAA
jgi:hypothetical protein